ncbi:MAG: hypothetical protein QXR63_00245 [Candidatus Bathyarchaeia archaeon]
MNIYVGDASDVVKRILTNHCSFSSNVEASALRCAVAEAMGYRLKRTKRPSGSTRIRIDLPNPRAGEDMVSAYIHAGRWKYIICKSYDEAHDFQWYVINQLKPLLNKNVKSWKAQRTQKYQNLLKQLLSSKPMKCTDLSKEHVGPGVYVFFHELTPKNFEKNMPKVNKISNF